MITSLCYSIWLVGWPIRLHPPNNKLAVLYINEFIGVWEWVWVYNNCMWEMCEQAGEWTTMPVNECMRGIYQNLQQYT